MSLETYDHINIVGEASSGAEILALCQSLAPDVILLDVMLGKDDGIAIARQILSRLPDIKVIMLSGFLTEELLSSALMAGVMGYVLKNVSLEFLSEAVRDVSMGNRVLCVEALKMYQRIHPEPDN